MMRATLIVAIAAFGLACTSAGSIPLAHTEYWKNENFAAYERYAWLPSDAHRREATQAEDHRLHDLIRAAIDERLQAKGFAESVRNPDFLVTYHCKIAEQLDVEVIDRVWYGGAGDEGEWREVPRRVEFTSFDEGSIVIDLVKAANGKRVWRGVAAGRVSMDATPEQYKAIVDDSVRELLAEFPPAK